MALSEKIETTAGTFYIENDILVMRAKQDADFTLEATIEGVEARKKLQKGNRFLALIDTRLMFQVADEAREYGATKEVSELSLAMAILTGNSLAKIIIGNFYIKFNKPFIPTKLFKDEASALEWLETFR